MYRICKTEESAAQQRKLERCLLETMKQKPYAEISIGELTAQVGISRIAFYRYFKSKDGCLRALLDHTMTDFSRFEVPEEYKQLECDQYFVQLCAYWLHLKPLLDVLNENRLMLHLVDSTVSHVTREVADRFLHIPDSRFREDVAAFAVGGMLTMLHYWYLRSFDHSISEMAHLLEQFLNVQLSSDFSKL